MSATPLNQIALDALANAGLPDAEEVKYAPAAAFDNAEAIYRLGPLLLRFVRDRGQIFLDLGSVNVPSEFWQFDDVEIAMGWKSIDEVLSKREPERLDSLLERVRVRSSLLGGAFSGEQAPFTRARLQRAARERGEAFVERLRARTLSCKDDGRPLG
jgi:hypothetical protein